MDVNDDPRIVTTREIYQWQAEQFGVGIAQNYGLAVVEECSEMVEVIDRWEGGDFLVRQQFLDALAKEEGDALITLHSLAGFEGFELADAIEEATDNVEARFAFHVAGPSSATRRVMIEAGKVARSVLKRAQQIRATDDEWSAAVRRHAGATAAAVIHLGALEGLAPAPVVAARWDQVTGRDPRGRRLTGSMRGGSEGQPEPAASTPEDDERAQRARRSGGDFSMNADRLQAELERARCAQEGELRVGDGVSVLCNPLTLGPDGEQFDRGPKGAPWWPGFVTQFGPAPAVHGLAALSEGDVRVALEMMVGGPDGGPPPPLGPDGPGTAIVRADDRPSMLRRTRPGAMSPVPE